MDWLADLGVSWLYVLGVLVALAVPFAVLARLTPCNPGGFWWKDLRGAVTDVLYWLVGPLVGRSVRPLPPEPIKHLGGGLVRGAALRAEEAEQAGRRPALPLRAIAALPRVVGLRVGTR